MDSVGKYQIVHADGTRLSPVDMATLAEMVYAGIVQTDTELFAVASSRTVKAGEIPYLAFLISRLKESPSAPPPRLPVTEPARPAASPPTPRQARAPRAPQQQSIPEPLYAEPPVAPPPAIVLPEPEPEPIVLETPEPALPPVLEPEPESAPDLQPLRQLDPEPELAAIVEAIPAPAVIPIEEPVAPEVRRETWEAPASLVFETPSPAPEPEVPLEQEPELELVQAAQEAPQIPLLEIAPPELPQETEPVAIEVAISEAPVLSEPPAIVLPEPEPLEISLEINATAPPPLPVEVVTEPAPSEPDAPLEIETVAATAPVEPVVETPPVEAPPVPEPEPAPEPKKADASEPPPAKPERRAGQRAKRRPITAQQKRTYTIISAIALPCIVGLVVWQQITGATAQKEHQAIVGAWEQADGSSVVFKPDGTGAMTRPDPIYGNRTHLFRWERRGAEVRLTEKRILMPGGTRQTAADSTEPVGLSPDGLLLHFGDMDLAKVP